MFLLILFVTLILVTLGVIVYAVWAAYYLKGVIAVADGSVTNPWRITVIDVISALVLGTGVLLLASPAALYWWTHGDYDRYPWIIRGTPPYNQFGGGPFQLWVYVLLLFSGLVGISLGIMLRWWFYVRLGALVGVDVERRKRGTH